VSSADGTALASLWASGPIVVQAGRRRDVLPGRPARWAAGPAEVVAQLISAKQNTDHCPARSDSALRYARRGWIDEQVGGRARCAGRCNRLLAALSERCRPRSMDAPERRLLLWLTLPVDAADLARRCGRRQRGGASTPFFDAGLEEPALSFSNVDDGDRHQDRAPRAPRRRNDLTTPYPPDSGRLG
jgi:2-aminoadipate transaminase